MTQISEAPQDFDSYFKMPDHVDHDSQYKITQWIKIMLNGTASFYVPEYDVEKAALINQVVSEKGFKMLCKVNTQKSKFGELYFQKI